jgi:hypothetical protein
MNRGMTGQAVFLSEADYKGRHMGPMALRIIPGAAIPIIYKIHSILTLFPSRKCSPYALVDVERCDDWGRKKRTLGYQLMLLSKP